ncbi:hypothetical protein MPSEU_000391400 [Mayamaea pseudoterrestris]|nr:hypothetical protein MPSEU_000391400 [Mayamaea pseudoterrestris]
MPSTTMIPYYRQCLHWALSIFLFSIHLQQVESFQITKLSSQSCLRRSRIIPVVSRARYLHLFDAKAIAVNADTSFSHQDKNGKDIAIDSLVRVAAPGLKAFQVNKNGFGSYNDQKVFVPNSETPYLLIPEGLRGRVIRVYDENLIGANFPILVKFVPGEECAEDGYDAPVPFTMHFLPEEVECV